MKIESGNRKVVIAITAMIIMSATAITLTWLKAEPSIILETLAGIGAVAGVTGYYNVKTHQAQCSQPTKSP